MSSMSRSIRRGMAKKQGTFEAQKPLRNRNQPSMKDLLLQFIRNKRAAKLVDEKGAK